MRRFWTTVFAAIAGSGLIAPGARARQDTDVAALVSLASGWTTRFEMSLSGLLFRETYRQSATTEGVTMHMSTERFEAGAPRREGNRGESTTEANLFLIKPSAAEGFVVYRDVYAVSGSPVTDHTNRLRELLEQGTESAMDQAQKLTDESARLNIGDIVRNINIPTLAYQFLKPANLSKLRVRAAGREALGERPLTIVEFEEVGRPTVVRGPNNTEQPATGRYWIDPSSGAVPRAVVEFLVDHYRGRIEARLALEPQLSAWVPVEMTEVWHAGSRRVNGVANYDKFQRLAVSTTEIMK